jgi:hypothetical protein
MFSSLEGKENHKNFSEGRRHVCIYCGRKAA